MDLLAPSGKSTARRPSKWDTPSSVSRGVGVFRQVISRGSPPRSPDRSPLVARKNDYKGREGDRSRERGGAREDRIRSREGGEPRSRSRRRHN